MRDAQITAEIIADSINKQGNRLTSYIVTIPRIVLAEFNTHRMLSRNSASSRAIPFDTMLDKVMSSPFIPIKWQKDHSGMQGSEYLEGEDEEMADKRWLAARDSAVANAKILNKNVGITKQFCNRLLEPFLYHTIIVTASDWENFFALRAHPAAEIHIDNLAHKMLSEYNQSTPKLLNPGEWHIPFGDKMDQEKIGKMVDEKFEVQPASLNWHSDRCQDIMVKIATARCARVSYLNYEGKDDYDADIKLHDRLSSMGHWSPFEHCAKAMNNSEYHRHHLVQGDGDPFNKEGKEFFGVSGNFKGFIQYRKTFKGENKKDDRVL